MERKYYPESVRKYHQKVYSRIELVVMKEDREVLNAYAQEHDLPVAEVIKRLLVQNIPGFKGYREG